MTVEQSHFEQFTPTLCNYSLRNNITMNYQCNIWDKLIGFLQEKNGPFLPVLYNLRLVQAYQSYSKDSCKVSMKYFQTEIQVKASFATCKKASLHLPKSHFLVANDINDIYSCKLTFLAAKKKLFYLQKFSNESLLSTWSHEEVGTIDRRFWIVSIWFYLSETKKFHFKAYSNT